MSFAKPKENKEEMTNIVGMPTAQPVAVPTKVEAFLGKGSRVVGSLTFSGPVEIDGYIEGEISAQDKLIIGESAVINGKLNGPEVVVRGSVTGDIFATKKLALRRPAKVVGNITSSSISIEEGVIFEGKCSMGSTQPTSEIKNFPSRQTAPEKSN